MSERKKRDEAAPTLQALMLDLCARAEPGRSISPAEAAQAFSALRGEDASSWRQHLGDVRTAAVKLAEAGRLVIYRKGKPIDGKDFRGVYRIGAPRSP